MSFVRVISITIALLFVLAPAALATAQNDAGLGIDAPNDSALSAPLSPGAYSGQVIYSEGDKEDWYRFTVPDCQKLVISFRATSGSLFGGEYGPTGILIQSSASSGSTVTFPAIGGVINFGLGDNAGVGTATYTFSATLTNPQNDAGTGCDAPDDSSLAVSIPLGSYTGVLLHGAGDHEDWYRVTQRACSGLTFTFRATSGRAYGGIYDATGGLIASALSTGASVTLRTMVPGPLNIGIGDSNGVGIANYAFGLANLQNDANTGCDAPNDSTGALPMGVGTTAGNIWASAGDKEDWYKINVPACTVLRITFHSSGPLLYAGLYTDDGVKLAQTTSAGENEIFVASGGPFRFGIGNNLDAGYSFSSTIVQQATPPLCPQQAVVAPDPANV